MNILIYTPRKTKKPHLIPTAADQLFDPSRTTKTVGKGTGLGPTMARPVVGAMNGSIFAAPIKGGTRRHSTPTVERGQARDAA